MASTPRTAAISAKLVAFGAGVTAGCFVVHPEHRGEGIASALLEAACADLKAQGLRYAVGFARTGAPTQSWHTFATFNYHGPLSMYEKAGFTKLREGDGWAVMRKEL